MKITFPAMRGKIGNRDYYSCMVSLGEIPRLFTFTDWAELPVEHRQQRVLNRSRIGPISRYILENEDGFLFSSIVASFQGTASFAPVTESGEMGFIEMDLTNAKFIINDGQHRSGGITAALKENPDLATQTINVLLFPYENLQRVQQMFSDLNRYVVRTPQSLNILFDQRDPIAQVTLAASELVPGIAGMIDKEATSLGIKSPKLFPLMSLYDATKEYLAPIQSALALKPGAAEVLLYQDQVQSVVEFWTEVTHHMADWQAVTAHQKAAPDIRRDTISTHSITLRSIGYIGGSIRTLYGPEWKKHLALLSTIDWRKTNPAWTNTVIVGGSVVSNRQARKAMNELLWRMMQLPERAATGAPAEQKAPRSKQEITSAVSSMMAPAPLPAFPTATKRTPAAATAISTPAPMPRAAAAAEHPKVRRRRAS